MFGTFLLMALSQQGVPSTYGICDITQDAVLCQTLTGETIVSSHSLSLRSDYSYLAQGELMIVDEFNNDLTVLHIDFTVNEWALVASENATVESGTILNR